MSEQRLKAVEENLLEVIKQQVETNALLKVLGERVNERVAEGKEFRGMVQTTVFGDVDTVGIITRIDRLEQSHKRSKWFARAVLGAFISLAASAVWALVAR